MPNKSTANRNTSAKKPSARRPSKRRRKRRIRWSAVIIALILLFLAGWGVKSCCTAVFSLIGENDGSTAPDSLVYETTKPIASTESVASILAGEPSPAKRASNRWSKSLDSMPDHNCIKLHTDAKFRLKAEFNDSNYLQYDAAKSLGINPIGIDGNSAWDIRRPIVNVVSCENYYIDNLTHSYPYLVPEAENLLNKIGYEFRKRLKERGGGDYRIKVTSLLRTPVTVGKLRRVNVNAVDSSAHIFATTFDISFSRFICDRVGINRTQEDLKLLLAEVLADLRNQGRCYVKYEAKQSCFHITTRPHPANSRKE